MPGHWQVKARKRRSIEMLGLRRFGAGFGFRGAGGAADVAAFVDHALVHLAHEFALAARGHARRVAKFILAVRSFLAGAVQAFATLEFARRCVGRMGFANLVPGAVEFAAVVVIQRVVFGVAMTSAAGAIVNAF